MGWSWARGVGVGVGLTVLALASLEARGDPPPAPADRDLEQLTLDELLDIEVTTPTTLPEPLREAPSLVTVVTAEEIRRTGARDLIDVLRLVPGFSFGVDVAGAVSLGFRGNWGEEGKVLVLLDGHELNETLYLTTLFGNELPVELIERIEIIRGPGSVIYGGTAELAVINIVTRGARSLAGVQVTGTWGQMDGVRGRSNVSLAARHVFPELGGLGVGVQLYLGDGIRSGERYRDVYGTAYRLTNAELDPRMVSVSASWKGLDARFLVLGQHTTHRDGFGRSLARHVDQSFFGVHADARYRWQLHERLALTPRVSYKRQTPWETTGLPDAEPVYYAKSADRIRGELTLEWRPSSRLSVLAGGEAFDDRAWLDDLSHVGTGTQLPLAGGERDSVATLAAFSQLVLRASWINVAVGARYEHNLRFGGAFLPRVGVTSAYRGWHAKALYSQAFKAPGHENYALNVGLQPERATTWELEVGYQVAPWLYASAAGFDVTIRDPIIYTFDQAMGGERYVNEDRTGTRGVASEVRFKVPRGFATLRHAYYTAEGKNEVEAYRVPGRDDVLRAMPAHKVTLHGSLEAFAGIQVGPSILWQGARHGTVAGAADGTPIDGKVGPDWLLGVFVTRDDLLVPGLDVGVGVHDLLDEGERYLQPHDSGHAPLPGPAREWILRVGYHRPFP